jgi:anti-anti-sigma factor
VTLDIDVAEGVGRLTVSGELDLETAPALSSAAAECIGPGVGSLRIDMAGVTFMDSTGLSALIAIRNMTEGAGQTLVLANLQHRVMRIIEITGMTVAFTIE